MQVDGKTFIAGQMYVEYRIPAKQTHPYPIIMVHGGTRSGANWTGTPDGREGWAQYFVRRGYAVYVVDQPGRGRSAYVPEVYGPPRLANAESAQQRYLQQAKHKLWPQAKLHNQWPGSGEIDDPASHQILGSFLPEIAFPKSVAITHAAMLQLIDRIGPSIMLVHSQGGPMGWLAADARPDVVRAIVAVEPNGPPGPGVRFVGAPEWFKDGPVELPYGVTPLPITFSPPVKDPSEIKWVKEDKPDAPDLVTCWKQAEPARQLPNLQRMPIVLITVGSVVSRGLRPLHRAVPQPGRRDADLDQARRPRHPRQQPQHDAGEELRRDRRGDLSVAGEDAAGVAIGAIVARVAQRNAGRQPGFRLRS